MKTKVFTILIAGILLSACGGKTDDASKLAKLKKDRMQLDAEIKKIEKAAPDTGRKAIPVSVVPVQSSNFSAFIEVQSRIEGDENIMVTSQAPGTVTSINVHTGQRVSKGQVLATLDAAAIDQQILAQDVQVQLAKTVYEKQQRLWAQQIGSEIQLLQTKASYDAALKQKQATIAQRNMYRITSPISGTVDEVNLKLGDQVGGMSPNGIRVVSLDKLKAEAQLGESYLGKVKQGDPVTLIFSDLNDSIQTKLSYVATSVDPISSSFLVQVRLGSNNKLRPNMSCRMKISNYQSSSAITVPVNVIQKTADGDVLYVAEGNKARSVIVKTGRVANGQIEVLNGLQSGDLVITEGYQNLDDGSLISTP